MNVRKLHQAVGGIAMGNSQPEPRFNVVTEKAR
jgi:hypothetical protein